MTNYTELSYNELMSIVKTHKAALICGNGLSINFDEGYMAGKLSERLFETHCHIIKNYDYDVFGDTKYNAALKENVKGTFDALGQIKSQDNFNWLFSSALAFAKSIVGSEKVLNWLNTSGNNLGLTFGLSPITLLETIVAQADKYDIFNVNYEHLTILIYFVIALKKAPQEIYRFDITNLFVQAVSWGCRYRFTKQQGNGDALQNAIISGMFAYYRFLYASNILMNGKSYHVEQLQNWNGIDRQSLSAFLNMFDFVMTTNYDKILDNISSQKIHHLHGEFSMDRNIVLHQTLGVKYGLTRYDISTILIGDYFLSKAFLPNSASLAMGTGNNSKYDFYSKILEKTIRGAHTEAIVKLGLNIENDYHILRYLQILLESGGVKSPKIIYCYYTEADKDSFLGSYDKCITYSTELSEFVRNNISVYVVKSQDVLNHIL